MKAVAEIKNLEDYQGYTVDQLMREIGQLRQHVERQQYMIHKLQKEANEDALTGVPNRRAFEELLHHALSDFKRYGHSGAVLLIDVDAFKSINDTLGHLVGDKVLQHVARVLSDNIRETDVVARLAGDEFVVLLREVDGKEARAKAYGLMQAFSTTPCLVDGRDIQVSISAGACAFHQEDTVKGVLLNADAEMYRIKALGK